MRRILGFITATLVAVGLLVVPAMPAQAASYTYIVVNDRVCPGKSKVRGILYHNLATGKSSRYWDNGDNIVYPEVKINRNNKITMQVRCDKKVALFFWQPVGYTSVQKTIKPTRSGQTFWVG